VIIISVWKNCYLFRTGDDNIAIEYNQKENIDESVKLFKPNNLMYSFYSKNNLKFVRDPEGNYYYLAKDCQKIQK